MSAQSFSQTHHEGGKRGWRGLLRTRKRKVVAVVAVLMLVIGGVALAAWLTSQTGQGNAKIGSLVKPSITFGATQPTSLCTPGNTCAGTFEIASAASNGPLTLTSVVDAPGASGDTSSDPTNCPLTNLTVPTQSGLTIPIPVGTTQVTIPDVYKLSATAPTGCQGVTMKRSITATFATP